MRPLSPGSSILTAMQTAPARSRFVVCGGDNLAFRLVHELVEIHGFDVTVVCRESDGEGPSVADIPGVTVVIANRLTREVCRRIRLEHVDALALVEQNDGGNIDAALMAREWAPHVRIVMRLFDETLAESMHDLLRDCVVLSATAVAAPAFVAAAQGGDQPTPLRVAGRLLYVTERRNTGAEDIVCVLSAGTDSVEPRLLQQSSDPRDLVLTATLTGDAADDVPAIPAQRSRASRIAHGERIRKRARRRSVTAFMSLVGRRLWLVAIVVAVLLAAATAALMAIRHIDTWQALYLAALTTIGGAEPDLRVATSEKILQVLLTLLSIALVPAATAAVVEAVVSARLALYNGGLASSVRDHVVVVGLGDLGTRVLAALDDAGEAVVGIDLDPNARGVAVARQRHVPVVIGDAKLEATMRSAEAASAHGLVVLTGNDVTNLEAALIGRKLGDPRHTVLRIFDTEFAERIQRAFGFATSRSVSSLAAPSFAAAMLSREVIGTIAVHRRVLVVAEIAVGAGSLLEGVSVAQLGRDGETQVVAIRTGRGEQVLWTPPAGRQLSRNDQYIAITTRAGLGSLLARATVEPGGAPAPLAVVDLTRPGFATE